MDRSIELASEAVDLRRTVFPGKHPETAASLNALAGIYAAANKN